MSTVTAFCLDLADGLVVIEGDPGREETKRRESERVGEQKRREEKKNSRKSAYSFTG